MRRFRQTGEDRAQSASVGMIALVAVVVTTVSVGGAFALGAVTDGGDPAPTADVAVTASVDRVAFDHRGGESFDADELAVIVAAGGDRSRIDVTASMASGDGGEFAQGETIAVPVDLTGQDRADIVLVHVPSQTVLFDGRRAVEPLVTDLSAQGDGNGNLRIEVSAERRLSTLNVSVEGPDVNTTLTRSAFTRQGTTYVGTAPASAGGEYTITVEEAGDGTGITVGETLDLRTSVTVTADSDDEEDDDRDDDSEEGDDEGEDDEEDDREEDEDDDDGDDDESEEGDDDEDDDRDEDDEDDDEEEDDEEDDDDDEEEDDDDEED